jgi:hypothetical protein
MAKIDKYKAANEKCDAKRGNKPWWKRLCRAIADPENIQNTLLAFFTGCLIVVGMLQKLTLDDQKAILEKTDQTMRAAQRPWIGNPKIAATGNLKIENGNLAFPLRLKFTNSGHSPAILVAEARVLLLETTKDFVHEVRDICAVQKNYIREGHPDAWGGKFSVFPGATQSFDVKCDIGRIECDTKNAKIPDGTTGITLLVVGCAAYADVGNFDLLPTKQPINQTGFIGTLSVPSPDNPLNQPPTVKIGAAKNFNPNFRVIRQSAIGVAN